MRPISNHDPKVNYPVTSQGKIVDLKTTNPALWEKLSALSQFVQDNQLNYLDNHTGYKTTTETVLIGEKYDDSGNLVDAFVAHPESSKPLEVYRNSPHLLTSTVPEGAIKYTEIAVSELKMDS